MIQTSIRVEGLEQVRRNLDRKITSIPEFTFKGLIKAGFLIQRESQKKVPVDTANLKASAFTIWSGQGLPGKPNFKGNTSQKVDASYSAAVNEAKGVVEAQGRLRLNGAVSVGYGAFYALYVHEDMDAAHKVGQAKFLEAAIAENEGRLMVVIREEAKKGL